MRKLFSMLILVSIGLIAFTGCTKSSPSAPQTTNTSWPYVMTETVDGTAFSRDTCIFWINNVSDTTSAQILGWNGADPTTAIYYPWVTFSFNYHYHGIGTYGISDHTSDQTPCGAGLHTADPDGGYAVSGSLTITALYPNVVGTFNFVTYSGKVVSNGNFVAKRQ
jgi:hypothetical protein